MADGFEPGLYKGKRVLVTGDTGFKGSWLALWLHMMGAKVYGFALPPDGPETHYAMLGLGNVIHHTDGDIRDLAAVQSAFATAEPEVVFHLAAQALVKRSYAEPKDTFDTNIGGGVNVLEAIRTSDSVRACVFITSDKAYENVEWTWGYRENDRLGGKDPYSASKGAMELVFRAYDESFLSARPDIGLATTRAGNVIGGGDWSADRIVPDCIRALNANEPIRIRMPHATRPWQHVLEPLSGYLHLGSALLREPKRYGGAWNFGPGDLSIATVGDLAQTIADEWGQGTVRLDPPSDAPYEATLLHLNVDRARFELGWRSRWTVEQTLHRCVEWYRSVLKHDVPADTISRQQIEAYMATAQ